jgi:hypothetical protein
MIKTKIHLRKKITKKDREFLERNRLKLFLIKTRKLKFIPNNDFTRH